MLQNYQLKTVWSVYSPYNLAFTAFRRYRQCLGAIAMLWDCNCAKHESSAVTLLSKDFELRCSAVFNLLPIWHEYFQQVEAAEEAAFAQVGLPLLCCADRTMDSMQPPASATFRKAPHYLACRLVNGNSYSFKRYFFDLQRNL